MNCVTRTVVVLQYRLSRVTDLFYYRTSTWCMVLQTTAQVLVVGGDQWYVSTGVLTLP
jgi:hypothetical protein